MVSYLCEITTHRGQCCHPTPPPCFIKQGKTRTQKFATKKSNSIVAVWFFTLFMCGDGGIRTRDLQRDKLAS